MPFTMFIDMPPLRYAAMLLLRHADITLFRCHYYATFADAITPLRVLITLRYATCCLLHTPYATLLRHCRCHYFHYFSYLRHYAMPLFEEACLCHASFTYADDYAFTPSMIFR